MVSSLVMLVRDPVASKEAERIPLLSTLGPAHAVGATARALEVGSGGGNGAVGGEEKGFAVSKSVRKYVAVPKGGTEARNATTADGGCIVSLWTKGASGHGCII